MTAFGPRGIFPCSPFARFHLYIYISRIIVISNPRLMYVGGGTAAPTPGDKTLPSLRKLLVSGEIFLGSALCASLTKMTLRAMDLLGDSSSAAKDMQVRKIISVHRFMCLLVLDL